MIYFDLWTLVRGFFRTPKIEALHRIISWFNSTPVATQLIPLLGLDDSPLSSNSWLSGILDANEKKLKIIYIDFNGKNINR